MKRITFITERILFWGALAIIVVAPTQHGIEIRNKMHLSLVDPLIWGFFFVWLICHFRRLKDMRFASLFGVLFVLVAALSFFKAENRMSVAKEVFQLAEYFIAAYALFAFLAHDPKRRGLAVDVFLSAGTLIVLLSLIQYISKGVPAFKVAGTFGNRNVLGGYLALLLPLMAGVLLYEKNKMRIVWLGLMVITGLLINLSGGSLMGIIIALGMIFMARSRRAFVGLAALLLVGAFIVFPYLPRDNVDVISSSIQLFDDDGDLSRRYTEWQAATTMTANHPLLGVGAGNYQANIGKYYGILPSPPGPAEPDTQNLYMVIVSTMGLPGLAVSLGLLLSAGVGAMTSFGAAKTPQEKGIAIGLFGSILAFGIACLWSPLLVRGIGIPLAFVICFSDNLRLVAGTEIR